MRGADPDLGLRAMDIKLHLGAHRCASTTFQTYLWANRTALAHKGVTCWTPRRTRDGLLRGLVRHPALITLNDERLAVRATGRMRIEFQRLERLGQETLLISEENLIGTLRNNLADTRLYPMLRERLLRFRPAFEGHRLQIGLCVRSYEDYWASALAYLLLKGFPKPSEDMLDFLTTQPRRWRSLVRDIAAVFPDADIMVWPFERLCSQPSAVLDIFATNASLSLPLAEIHRHRSPDVAQLNAALTLRGEARIDAGPRPQGQRWMPFDAEQTRVLRAEYRRDIAWLEAGAEGLARYVDGRQTPATRPDRALDVTGAEAAALAQMRGRTDGIEEGLGGSRAG